jgi:hypothetical protein
MVDSQSSELKDFIKIISDTYKYLIQVKRDSLKHNKAKSIKTANHFVQLTLFVLIFL